LLAVPLAAGLASELKIKGILLKFGRIPGLLLKRNCGVLQSRNAAPLPMVRPAEAGIAGMHRVLNPGQPLNILTEAQKSALA